MTLTILDVFGTDQQAEKSGRWFPLPRLKGAAICLRRMGGMNTLHAIHNRRVYGALAEEWGAEDLPADVILQAEAEIAAHALVADWRGMPGPEGAPVPFTVEECIRLFVAAPDFLVWCKDRAREMENYQTRAIQRDQAALGNG